jgi:hypothetical protein
MHNRTNAVCFTCGLTIESPPRLSRLTNGQVCPACRERVLDGLPPALPSRPGVVESAIDPRELRSESSEFDEPS